MTDGGLSDADATRRLAEDGPNETPVHAAAWPLAPVGRHRARADAAPAARRGRDVRAGALAGASAVLWMEMTKKRV